jgi:hypothetical protein
MADVASSGKIQFIAPLVSRFRGSNGRARLLRAECQARARKLGQPVRGGRRLSSSFAGVKPGCMVISIVRQPRFVARRMG